MSSVPNVWTWHKTKHCHMPAKCLYCAALHKSEDCPLINNISDESHDILTPVYKCINCDGKHQANSYACPKRNEYIQLREAVSMKNNPKYRKQNIPNIVSQNSIDEAIISNSRNFPQLNQPRRNNPVWNNIFSSQKPPIQQQQLRSQSNQQ